MSVMWRKKFNRVSMNMLVNTKGVSMGMSLVIRQLNGPLKWLLASLFLVSLSVGKLYAHGLDQSYIFLLVNDGQVSGRIEVTIADINKALSLDLNTDQSVNRGDIETHITEIKGYLKKKISVTPKGGEAGLNLGDYELSSLPLAQYLVVHFTVTDDIVMPEYIDFDFQVLFDKNPDHRGFLVVENNWKTGTFNNEAVVSSIFSPGNTSQRLDFSSSTLLHGFWAMVKLGVHHIWIGIDHILFLLALLLPSVVFRREKTWIAAEEFRTPLIYVVKIVSLFTIAHTITLSIATLTEISLSSRIVESIIAISIAVAALDILYPIFKSRIWLIVFAFGLFHGFGFASVLSEIGIPSNYMTHSLLAFNIGVELGQIAIVCVIFPILYLIRHGWFYHKLVLQYGALALITISLYWFIERGFLIDLPAGQFANWVLGFVGLTA